LTPSSPSAPPTEVPFSFTAGLPKLSPSPSQGQERFPDKQGSSIVSPDLSPHPPRGPVPLSYLERASTEAPTGLRRATTDDFSQFPTENSWFGAVQPVEGLKSFSLGGVVALWSVPPFTALHYFVLYPIYESTPQWQFDTGAAFLQGAFFALVFRYAVRDNDFNSKVPYTVFNALCWIRSLSRVHVPMSCLSMTSCKFWCLMD